VRGTHDTDERNLAVTPRYSGDPGDLFAVDITDYIPPPPWWWGSAACRKMPLSLFYDVSPSRERRALAACERCEVREECLDDALDRGDLFGVRGGMTPTQRKKLRRKVA